MPDLSQPACRYFSDEKKNILVLAVAYGVNRKLVFCRYETRRASFLHAFAMAI